VTKKIVTHRDLDVYAKAFETAMKIFDISKSFPKEETYSLTDQLRRSSRSVCANLAEAWRRQRYEAAFISKLNECEAEAAETQVWVEFAVGCGYVAREVAEGLYRAYNQMLTTFVGMINHPQTWVLFENKAKR
jgi:four helix bundle protein